MSPGDVTAAGRGAAGISGVPRPPANGEGQGGIRSVHGGASDAYRFVIIIPELDPRPAVHLSVTMTTTYGFGFDDFARPRSRGARIARIDALATLLDTALVIPGTGVRFGLDALIGLFPVVGDIITTALSLFIVHEAYQLGAPGHVIARMLGNVALDGVFGAVPL